MKILGSFRCILRLLLDLILSLKKVGPGSKIWTQKITLPKGKPSDSKLKRFHIPDSTFQLGLRKIGFKPVYPVFGLRCPVFLFRFWVSVSVPKSSKNLPVPVPVPVPSHVKKFQSSSSVPKARLNSSVPVPNQIKSSKSSVPVPKN